ncbi:MAG: hypothetical protein SH850_06840 [Planctomycetaceae bacterium]|nr:hypothetical protein [Planctomycetaceae bacterium]
MDDSTDNAVAPILFDITQQTCPMCGGKNEQAAATCANCGETLRGSASNEELTVPLYSAKLIGICTFFWTELTGMTLLWLNCRRLGLFRESQQVLLAGIAMTVVAIVFAFVLPDSRILSIGLNIILTVVVVKYAQSMLGPQFDRQRKQKGPYASTWLANGLGLLMVLVFLSLIIGVVVVLEVMGIGFEE